MSRRISKTKRARILERFGHRCRRCQGTKYLQIDHIRPIAKGGTNEESNLQVLCEGCNLRKWDHLPGTSIEHVVLRWAERVFGPAACNANLTPHKARSLAKLVRIYVELEEDAPLINPILSVRH